MRKEFFIIANPVAGTQKAPRLAISVVSYLKQHDVKAEIILSKKPKEAIQIAREIESPGRIIVACGGDGTIQEIITGIKNSETEIGIIPGGRCNDFAAALGIHRRLSPAELARILLTGKARTFDCGETNGKKFLTVATLGFDSEVSRFVETHKMFLKGTAAYLYALVRVLLNYHPISVKLQTDTEKFEGKVFLCATANTPFYGGAMKIAPDAVPDDGYFHICIVKEVSWITVLRMLPRVFKGTHISHPAVKILKTKSLRVDTPGANNWICADGESLTQTPCKFIIREKSLKIICP